MSNRFYVTFLTVTHTHIYTTQHHKNRVLVLGIIPPTTSLSPSPSHPFRRPSPTPNPALVPGPWSISYVFRRKKFFARTLSDDLHENNTKRPDGADGLCEYTHVSPVSFVRLSSSLRPSSTCAQKVRVLRTWFGCSVDVSVGHYGSDTRDWNSEHPICSEP